MPTIFLFIAALIVVLFLIKFLHARQVGASRNFAEQSSPLPPLQEPETPSIGQISETGGIGIASEVSLAAQQSLPWQDEVKALRDAGRFQEALTLCRRQYPKMLAFRQTLITLRAKMRQDNDPSDALLNSLYQTAMLGDLCRERKTDAHDFDEITSHLSQLDNPRQYWQQVGYQHLQMLSKTDRRILVEHWGEPHNHGYISELIQ